MADREIHWYPPGPQARAFMRSKAFMAGIRGPIGSGKSTTAVVKLAKNAQHQKPGSDGVARRRTAIVRNTYPELATTTIKTWHQWFPPECGEWREKGPPRHLIRRYDADRKLIFEWEVLFVALDSASDVAKVLSMELSDAWINEAREVPKAIVDGLTGRIGRYPRTEKDAAGKVIFGCNSPQLLMDTNPPETDHWWYALAERDTSNERGRQMLESMDAAESELREKGLLGKTQKLVEFFAQPGGRATDAENLQNLDPAYYIRAMAGKDADWIKVYIDGEYGFVKDGKPVYPEYRDGLHCKPFEIMRGVPLWLGIDFGLTPAATFSQRTTTGRWLTHSELVTEDMGVVRFSQLLKATLSERYATLPIGAITGDPAGDQRQAGSADESTCFALMKAQGVEAQPAETNDPITRREVVAKAFSRIVDGEPGKIIHPNCAVLRKGYQGGYAYKRVQVAGEDRYRDKPDKNRYSHPCEADQYGMLGAGEGRAIIRRDPTIERERRGGAEPPRFAIVD